MRKNFAQILKQSINFDVDNEYDKVYELFYGNSSIDGVYHYIKWYFGHLPFVGTCLDVDEFNDAYGFDFEHYPESITMDDFISFIEYCYNLMKPIVQYQHSEFSFLIRHIEKILETVGYIKLDEDGFIIFVEKSQAAIAVAEILPEDISYKAISYNHHSMQGNLEAKKDTLLKFANLIEPKRKDLQNINSKLENDIFYLFNNLNIRHNNIEPNTPKYKKYVANMSNDELEHWYDETYQMCLLAFLELEHIERKKDFDKLKSNIENT